jgi:hypothetical protein
MPVYRYLDLSTAHLTEAEDAELRSRLADLEHSPRVIVHDYGYWINVPDLDGSWDAEDTVALHKALPNLASCIDRARSYGCTWINFDRDAGQDATLPTFDW